MARSKEKEGAPATVRFYQLAEMPLPKAMAGIAAKAVERGMKACVWAGNRVKQWDDLLWTTPAESFLPHGPENGPDPENQPVLVCSEPSDVNGATVLLCVPALMLEEPDRFDLVIDFVHGADPHAVQESRARYRHYRDAGCAMEYWTQRPAGGWEKK